jgi:hypothetical protein
LLSPFDLPDLIKGRRENGREEKRREKKEEKRKKRKEKERISRMSSQQPQPRPTTLNFITGNANKLAEVQAILGEVQNLRLQSRNVEGNEIQGSIEEVARDKCSRAAEVVSLPFYLLFFYCLFFIFLSLSFPSLSSQLLAGLAGGSGSGTLVVEVD